MSLPSRRCRRTPVVRKSADKRGEVNALQEVIVTARRHQEDLQKVPISITAFSGEALKQQSVTQVYDLGSQIPGLFMQEARDDPQSIGDHHAGKETGRHYARR